MRSAQGGISKLSDGYWKLTVELPRGEDGKRRQRSKRVRGSRKRAQEVLNSMLAEAGHVSAGSLVSVSAFAEEAFLPHVRETCKTRTYEAYETRLRLDVLPVLGGMRLCDVRPQHVALLLDGLTPSKGHEARKVCSALFREALYRGCVESNPCKSVRPVPVPRHEPQVLGAEGALAYMEHFAGHPLEAAVLLAIGGGFRRGEIAALDVEDVDFATGAVSVSRGLVHTRNGLEGTTTKSSKPRTVHLPMTIASRLSDILPASGPVLSEGGKRIQPARITRLYERHLKSLPDGIPRVLFKYLRHTSLTLAYDSGSDVSDVRNRGGHSADGVTERYYLRPTGLRDLEAAERMDALLATSGNNEGGLQPPDGKRSEEIRRAKLQFVESF